MKNGRKMIFFVLLILLGIIFLAFTTGCKKKQQTIVQEEIQQNIEALQREQTILRSEIDNLKQEIGQIMLEQERIVFMMSDDTQESPLVKTTIKISLVILLLVIILLLIYSLYQRKMRRDIGQDVLVTEESDNGQEPDSRSDDWGSSIVEDEIEDRKKEN